MSILQRNNHSPPSVNVGNENSSNHNKSNMIERAPNSGQHNQPVLKRRRSKEKLMSKSSRLLWVIGTITVVVAIVNYAHSLAHHGLLPTGIKFTIDFGNSQENVWHFGMEPSKDQTSYHDDSERHFLPPPPNSVNNIRQEIMKAQARVAHERAKAFHAARGAAAPGKPGKPISGIQLQYQKEKAKGQVHPIRYYIQMSQEQGHDKEKLLYLLRDNAGIRVLSETSYQQLPSWSQVTSMYGDRPRLVGTEQCAKFQADGDIADKYLGVAGAFNSGTNLLAKTLVRNCVLHKRQAKHGAEARGIRWQVPYGKHTPPKDEDFRNNHVAKRGGDVDARLVLPVVAIRSPSFWLQSMCSHHYTSRWPRVFRRGDPNYHCPNLYPLDAEKKRMEELGVGPFREDTGVDLEEHVKSFNATKRQAALMFVGILPKQQQRPGIGRMIGGQEEGSNSDTETDDEKPTENQQSDHEASVLLTEDELNDHYFPVHVKYSNFTRVHRSLIHYYQEWYQEYLELDDYPHLFVRMEDLLFFPDEVVPQICECAGGQLVTANMTILDKHIKVAAESAKAKHTTLFMEEGEEHTGYLDALIKYGNSDNRLRGLTPQDLQYANRHLDRRIVDLFGYEIPTQLENSNSAKE